MAQPIIFISVSQRLEPDRTAFTAGLERASSLIESTKARTAMFGAYTDEGRHHVRIVHVFPDADAMSAHFEGSDERTQAAAQLLAPVSFEVYGSAPDAAMALLRREAEAAGGNLGFWPHAIAGFFRGPA